MVQVAIASFPPSRHSRDASYGRRRSYTPREAAKTRVDGTVFSNLVLHPEINIEGLDKNFSLKRTFRLLCVTQAGSHAALGLGISID